MDKQRLLELAGITEAKYAVQPGGFVVVYINEEGFAAGVWGIFDNHSSAEEFLEEVARQTGAESFDDFQNQFDAQEPFTIEAIDNPKELYEYYKDKVVE